MCAFWIMSRRDIRHQRRGVVACWCSNTTLIGSSGLSVDVECAVAIHYPGRPGSGPTRTNLRFVPFSSGHFWNRFLLRGPMGRAISSGARNCSIRSDTFRWALKEPLWGRSVTSYENNLLLGRSLPKWPWHSDLAAMRQKVSTPFAGERNKKIAVFLSFPVGLVANFRYSASRLATLFLLLLKFPVFCRVCCWLVIHSFIY